MNLRHIEVFYAVYTCSSVSKAAQLLHVSQPSVSKVLQHAEMRLGYKLFERTQGRLIPTEQGKILFQSVKDIYKNIEGLRRVARNLKDDEQGLLKIVCMPSLGLELVPQVISRFVERHPKVHIDIQTLHSDNLAASLLEYDADLALAFDPAPHPQLQKIEVGEGDLGYLAGSEQQLGEVESVSLADAANAPLISILDSGPLGNLLQSALTSEEIDCSPNISVKTYHLAAALVGNGLGGAFIDQFSARSVAHKDTRFYRLKPRIQYKVSCLHMIERPLTPLMQEFVDTCAELLKEINQPGD